MAFNYDLNISKGSSYAVRLNIKDEAGLFVNLSGYTVSGFVKEKYSDSNFVLNLNTSIPIGLSASGVVDINISAPETASLFVNQYVYDVEIYKDTKAEKIIQGYVNIYPEVTR